jgi:hypothetical protein
MSRFDFTQKMIASTNIHSIPPEERDSAGTLVPKALGVAPTSSEESDYRSFCSLAKPFLRAFHILGEQPSGSSGSINRTFLLLQTSALD